MHCKSVGCQLRSIVLLAASLLLSSALASNALACEVSLIDFQIEDQFEAAHTQREFADTVSVFVWSDREASEFADAWEELLAAALRGQIDGGLVTLRSVAHVKGAPFFVKGRIRRSFSRSEADWALLDWKGRFRDAYEIADKTVTILIFDRQGCLIARESGTELRAQVVARLARAAQGALAP